jgi:cell division protein FtsQ
MKKPINWKKILWNSCWIIFSIGLIVLFGASIQRKNNKKCSAIKIEITGAEKHMFIDEKDVMELLLVNGPIEGAMIHSLSLRKMETLVEQNAWVKNAEMFFDNNQVLQINIEERQPVARMFQIDGNSFYLDTAAVMLPLSNKLSVRVPVFTGFKKELIRDTPMIQQIIALSTYIGADSFFNAQIAQIDIRSDKRFELIPLIGDHRIVFGDASELAIKFKKLKAFYKTAWLQNGMNTYEILDLQYKNQLVAVKKGMAKAAADSAAAMSLLKNGAMFPSLTDSVAPKKMDTTIVKVLGASPKKANSTSKVASSSVKLSTQKNKKDKKKSKDKKQ